MLQDSTEDSLTPAHWVRVSGVAGGWHRTLLGAVGVHVPDRPRELRKVNLSIAVLVKLSRECLGQLRGDLNVHAVQLVDELVGGNRAALVHVDPAEHLTETQGSGLKCHSV